MAFAVGLLCGLAAAGSYFILLPTESVLVARLAEENREVLDDAIAAFLDCHQRIEAIPEDAFEPSTEALSALALEFDTGWDDFPAAWNAEVISNEEFAILTDGVASNDRWESSNILDNDRPEFSHSYSSYESILMDLECLANHTEDADYFWGDLGGSRHLLNKLRQLRYLFVVRMRDKHLPMLSGDAFRAGYWEGQVFCYDVQQRSIIGQFWFASTNSDEVNYTYAENDEVLKAGSAMSALQTDLEDNIEDAFWARLHELIPGASSRNQHAKTPFDTGELAELRKFYAAESIPQKPVKAKQAEDASAATAENTDDRILQAAEQLSDETLTAVKTRMAAGDRIAAIKLLRDETGLGLRECQLLAELIAGKPAEGENQP